MFSSSPKSVLSSVLLTVTLSTLSIVKKLSEVSFVSFNISLYWEVLYTLTGVLLKAFFVTLPSVPVDFK